MTEFDAWNASTNDSLYQTGDAPEDEYYEHKFSPVALGYVGLVIGIGIVGNIATLVVQCREQCKMDSIVHHAQSASANVFSKNYSKYLISIAVNNLCALITLLITFLQNFIESMTIESYFTCNIATFLGYSGSFLCPWYIVFLTVERFIAVRYPFKSKYIITQRRTTLLLVAITGISVLYNSWLLVGLKTINSEGPFITGCVVRVEFLNFLPRFIMANLITIFSIPLVILVVLNTWMIVIIYGRTLKRASSQVKLNKAGTKLSPRVSRSTESDVNPLKLQPILPSRSAYSVNLSTSVRREQFRKLSKLVVAGGTPQQLSAEESRISTSVNSQSRWLSQFRSINLTNSHESLAGVRSLRPRVFEAIPKDDLRAMKKLVLVSLVYMLFNLPTYFLRLLDQLEIYIHPTVVQIIYFVFIAQFALHSSVYSTLVILRKKTPSLKCSSQEKRDCYQYKYSSINTLPRSGHITLSSQSTYQGLSLGGPASFEKPQIIIPTSSVLPTQSRRGENLFVESAAVSLAKGLETKLEPKSGHDLDPDLINTAQISPESVSRKSSSSHRLVRSNGFDGSLVIVINDADCLLPTLEQHPSSNFNNSFDEDVGRRAKSLWWLTARRLSNTVDASYTSMSNKLNKSATIL